MLLFAARRIVCTKSNPKKNQGFDIFFIFCWIFDFSLLYFGQSLIHHPIAIVASIKGIVQSGKLGVKRTGTGPPLDSKIGNANGFNTGTPDAYIWYDTDFVWYDDNLDWTISFIFRCIISQLGRNFRVRNYRNCKSCSPRLQQGDQLVQCKGPGNEQME